MVINYLLPHLIIQLKSGMFVVDNAFILLRDIQVSFLAVNSTLLEIIVSLVALIVPASCGTYQLVNVLKRLGVIMMKCLMLALILQVINWLQHQQMVLLVSIMSSQVHAYPYCRGMKMKFQRSLSTLKEIK